MEGGDSHEEPVLSGETEGVVVHRLLLLLLLLRHNLAMMGTEGADLHEELVLLEEMGGVGDHLVMGMEGAECPRTLKSWFRQYVGFRRCLSSHMILMRAPESFQRLQDLDFR